MKKIAIIGSHGLYANYGGWDQLVNNLAEKKSENINYLIFNSADSEKSEKRPPDGVIVKRLIFKASGFQGLFYDFWSILISYFKVDTILFLGVQGMPLIPFLRIFKKNKIISNVGGIEWERPKFGIFSKSYLKFCFRLSFYFSDVVVLDNPHYYTFVPRNHNSKVMVIPYGGEIIGDMSVNPEILKKYSFINDEYYLSISRSLKDNQIEELCESFAGSLHKLVLISNLSKSTYGLRILKEYSNYNNIVLIDGLYLKPELDLIRRKCKAYIHTHTLCGTAPSLVEMIVAQRPIISIDIPQNRYTLHNQAFFFKDFSDVQTLLNNKTDLSDYVPSFELSELYKWENIVSIYESIL